MKRIALILAIAFLLPCRAEDPPSAQEELEGILKRADDEDPEIRDAASKDLERWSEKTGAAAEAILGKATAGRSPEVQSRIRVVLGRFAETAADRKVLEMFRKLGLPSVDGKKFVEFNTGVFFEGSRDNSFTTLTGWVVEISETSITIQTSGAELKTLPRKRDLPAGWDRLKARCRNPEPPPGEFKELDFLAWLVTEVDSYRVRARDRRGRVFRPLFARDVMQLAVMASWAYQRGDAGGGHELLRSVLDSHAVGRPEAKSDEAWIAAATARALSERLVVDAHNGRALTELLDAWKRLQTLPENPDSAQVKSMVEGYEAQARQAAAFENLTPEEVAKLDVHDRAGYWVQQLQEIDSVQSNLPGPPVLGPDADWRRGDDRRPWPPTELVALGFDAVPALIAHLDDASPTRALGGKGTDPGNRELWLMTVGDACEQIFAEITWLRLCAREKNYAVLIREGEAARIKKEAQAWWEVVRNQTPEERLLGQLGTSLVPAASELLSKYGNRHLARIVEEVERRPDVTWQIACLDCMGPEHAGLLKAMLKASDGQTILSASEALARVANDRTGVDEILRRVKAGETVESPREDEWSDDPGASRPGLPLGPALETLSRYARKEGADLVVAMFRRKPEEIPLEYFEQAPRFADPRILEVLLPWLEQPEPDPPLDTDTPRFRDLAAETIALSTGFPDGWKRNRADAKECDLRIQQLMSWLRFNRDSIDWEALRKKSEQELEDE